MVWILGDQPRIPLLYSLLMLTLPFIITTLKRGVTIFRKSVSTKEFIIELMNITNSDI